MNREPSDELVELARQIKELMAKHEELFDKEYNEKVEPILGIVSYDIAFKLDGKYRDIIPEIHKEYYVFN